MLTAKQKQYIAEANKRWNFKSGAVRSGKSYVDVTAVIPMRIRERIGKDGLCFIVGVSKETIERNVLQPMRERYTSSVVGTINSRNIARVCGEDVYCLGAKKSRRWRRFRVRPRSTYTATRWRSGTKMCSIC